MNVLVGLGQLPPSMIRTWTAMTGSETRVLGLRDGLVAFRSANQIGVLNDKDGKFVWRVKNPDTYQGPDAISEQHFLAIRDIGSIKYLAEYDLATGRPLRRITLGSGYASGIKAFDGTVYVLMNSGLFLAFQESDLSLLWQRQLPQADGTGYIQRTTNVLFVASGHSASGLDLLGGTLKWELDGSMGDSPTIADGKVYLRAQHSFITDIETGQHLWEAPNNLTMLGVVEGVAIFLDWGNLEGRDWKTGRFLWRNNGGSMVAGAVRGGPLSTDGRHLLTSLELQKKTDRGEERTYTIRAINAEGQIDQSLPGRLPASMDPWITVDNSFWTRRYDLGSPAPIPDEELKRKELAGRLVEDYENLDRQDREPLASLGKFAATPLIHRFKVWAQAALSKDQSYLEPHRSLAEQALFDLKTMVGPNDSDAMIDALKALPSGNQYSGGLHQLYETHGDPSRTLEFAIPRVKAAGDDPDFDDWTILTGSRTREAEDIMIGFLHRPASPFWSNAYFSLSYRHGRARKAVVGVRPRRGPILTWQERFKGFVIGEGKDPKGRRWQFITSYTLGNGNDVFMRPWLGKVWGAPLFTGVETKGLREVEWPRAEDQNLFKGPVGQMWLRKLTVDPSIPRDSDDDGLSDLVEKRWKTDSHRADTDGDGVSDARDVAPLIRARPLGTREKIVQECYFRWSRQWPRRPLSFSVAGMKPFELVGAAPGFWKETGRRDIKRFTVAEVKLQSPRRATARVEMQYPDNPVAYITYQLESEGGEWFLIHTEHPEPPWRPD